MLVQLNGQNIHHFYACMHTKLQDEYVQYECP